MPVRRVKTSHSSIIGSFPSLKNSEVVRYESTIERDLFYLLEFDPNVTAYYVQPFIIVAFDQEGKQHRYIPDVEVIGSPRNRLIECKPQAKLGTPHVEQQKRIGTLWAEEHDYDFEIVTDIGLRTGHRLANIKLLWRYARLQISVNDIQMCRLLLSDIPLGVSFRTLAMKLSDDNTLASAPSVYHLLWQHFLIADLTQPLTPDTLIQLAP